jgi:DNA-3-methyladenine glycosylase II
MRSLMRKRKPSYDAAAAQRHLARSDPRLRTIVKEVGTLDIAPRGTPYQALMRSLLYQQLAGAAARAIEQRYLAMYGGSIPDPQALLATSAKMLRTAGISRQKASYLHSLAEHYASGQLNDRWLLRATDADVIETVTQVKGVGRWTADMLLMFCLGRPDILPVGDLGVRSAIRRVYELDSLPSPDAMEEIAQPWSPYRSAACIYLWQSTNVLTL